jgi:hypothetical protein
MKIEPVALERWVAQLLRAHGTRAAKADRVAAALVDADRCGQSSHGVRRLPYYVDEIASGALLVDADPVVVDRRGGLTVAPGAVARDAGHIGRLGASARSSAASETTRCRSACPAPRCSTLRSAWPPRAESRRPTSAARCCRPDG